MPNLGIPSDPQVAPHLLKRDRVPVIPWFGVLATIFLQKQALAIGKAIQTLPSLHPSLVP